MTFRFHRLPLLFSIVFLRNDPRMMQTVLGSCDLYDAMIDSGAFTNYHIWRKTVSGEKQHTEPITLKYYIKACKQFHGKAWQYVALDRIKIESESRRNLQEMLNAGLRPMPVMIISEPIERALELKEINPHVCVAGAVDRSTEYIERRFTQVYRQSGIGIHGLGYSRYPGLLTVPIASGDSSSWMVGGRYGNIVRYDFASGLSQVHWKKLGRASDLVYTQRIDWLSFLHTKLNIPYRMLKDPEYYRRNIGIPSVCTAFAYMRFSYHTNLKGVRLFLAVSNAGWLTLLFCLIATTNKAGDGFDYLGTRRLWFELIELQKTNKLSYMDRIRTILKTTNWQEMLPTLT